MELLRMSHVRERLPASFFRGENNGSAAENAVEIKNILKK